MLRVEADAIANEALHGSLAILEREMNVILAYLNNVGTQAALCIGFTFTLFFEVENPENKFISSILMLSAVTAFSSFVYTIVCATMSASLGPMMAFKGEDSSAMRRAVDSMKGDRRRIVNAFAFGMAAFEFMCLVLIWVKLIEEPVNAAICSVVLVLGFAYLMCAVRMMQNQYRLPENSPNTGLVRGNAKKVKGMEYIKRAAELQSAPGMMQQMNAKTSSGRL